MRSDMRKRAFGILGAVMALFCATSADARVFNCASGDVACLINAITAANANGHDNTIHLAAGTYTLTEPLTPVPPLGLPPVIGSITIVGAGAEATIIQGGTPPTFGLLLVESSGTLV